MNNETDNSETVNCVPEPRIRKRSGPSIVWLIPVITALIGGWLIIKTVSEKGPQITITFKTAEGIEAGKTKIKYKDIEIGVVDSVHFNSDFSRVIVNASMEKESEQFLGRETRFWVVKPRLSLRGASGLGTLISGAYIEIEPGRGSPQKHFVGLDIQPVIKADTEGTQVVLLTYDLGSLDTGSPIYYQGIVAGEVLGWELENDRKSIFIHSFINAPYDKLIKSNTKFWNVSGIDVSVGADGININTSSVQSLLYGGIAFDTPDSLDPVEEKTSELVFTLYDSYDSIEDQAFTKKVTFILFFDGSVRGLNVDAPVEFKGIKVGSVLDIRLEFDNRDSSFRIPVLIEIEPERIISRGETDLLSPYETFTRLIKQGLRARLQSGSLLTGQLFIDLDMHPDTPVKMVNGDAPFPELPTVPASMEQMTASVKSILEKFEKVNIENIGTELLETLQGTSQLAKGANDLFQQPDLQGSVTDLRESLGSLKSILAKLDNRVDPIALNLEQAIEESRKTLENVQVTMGLMNSMLDHDSPLQFEFIELADELGEMARSIRTLVDLLERNPNSIIFGKETLGE